ncbi:hypothetical protein [Microcoleus sp. B4-D4]|uniref:hypothetical protein n=1 Tax=Microcoleus sp. B4-D4 TaxID=2818667 RepID=UPI002FD5E26C
MAQKCRDRGKSASLTQMVQQLRHPHSKPVWSVSHPPNIRQGNRRRLADSIELRTVKVAVTLAVEKTEAKILVVYYIVLTAVFKYQIKSTKEGEYDINLAN